MRVRENLLRKIASKSDHKLYHHSAIILDGSRVVSQGFNLLSTHAEISAINKVKHIKDLLGCLLVSFRVNRHGRIGNSRPCKECMGQIRDRAMEVVYFDGKRWVQE